MSKSPSLIDKALAFWKESKFVAQINTKVDAGIQAKITGGAIKGKLNLVSLINIGPFF
jgi:hypothetical protein